MQIDFSKSKDGSGAEPVKPGAETQTVKTPAGDSIACRNTFAVPAAPGGLVIGDRLPTFSEIILPRLNLVHSVGNMKDIFSPGAFVYDQRLTLYQPPTINRQTSTVEKAGTPPLIVTFLGLRPTRFFEHVAGGARGLICETEQQVSAAGGTTSYQEWTLKSKDGMKRFDLAVDSLLAIERPEFVEDNDTIFTFAVDGKKLALALYNAKASAFTVLKRTVLTARSLGCLKGGYPTHSWALSSILKPTPDKSSTYWCPVLIPHQKATPAFLDFAASVLAAPQVDTPEAD